MKRADVVSVRNLFSGRARYRCGPARPGFVWGPHQVAQLIVDLENAARDSFDEEDVPEEALYLGVVTVSTPTSGVYTVLDGQQRFIVLAMFLAFARDRAASNRERNRLDQMLVRRGIGRPPEPRFRLTPEDHAWFAHFILPPGATKRLPPTAPLGSPRELLLAARFMEHCFSGYSADDLRSIIDFLLHHTAMVRSLAQPPVPAEVVQAFQAAIAAQAQPSYPAPYAQAPAPAPATNSPPRPALAAPPPPSEARPSFSMPLWNDPVPADRHRVAAE
ncbi:MAG: hypothetical protein RIR41_1667 [Pseudomonadota bacterium]|jgi:hypothetical protein|nr:DUF262 domain-containing protein [Hyphomonadaceae bacterium]